MIGAVLSARAGFRTGATWLKRRQPNDKRIELNKPNPCPIGGSPAPLRSAGVSSSTIRSERLGYLSQKSFAKYYEYSDVKPGPFSNIWMATGSKDGLYQIDIGGRNIGYNDQSYYLDFSKAGEHYFNLAGTKLLISTARARKRLTWGWGPTS